MSLFTRREEGAKVFYKCNICGYSLEMLTLSEVLTFPIFRYHMISNHRERCH